MRVPDGRDIIDAVITGNMSNAGIGTGSQFNHTALEVFTGFFSPELGFDIEMSVCTGGRLSYQHWLNGYIQHWVYAYILCQSGTSYSFWARAVSALSFSALSQ